MTKNHTKLIWRPRPYQVIPNLPGVVNIVGFGGRGSGKTWNGTRWLLTKALKYRNTKWGAVALKEADALNIIAEGEGGLKWHIEGNPNGDDPNPNRPISPDISFVLKGGSWEKAFNRSSGRMVLRFANGSEIHFASADKPKSLRGKNWHGALCDEVAFWPQQSFHMVRLAVRLRLPDRSPSQLLMTTTPDGENWFAQDFLMAAPKPELAFIGGAQGGKLPPSPPPSTFDNKDLDPAWRDALVSMYEGTDIGRQELYGELLSLRGAIYKGYGPDHRRNILEGRIDSEGNLIGYEWPTSSADCDDVIAGQDFGTVHPSAFIVLARRHDRWHAVAEVVQPAATEEEWWDAIRPTIEFWKPSRIYSESASPMTTNMQLKRGLPIVLADKGPDSVTDGIREVQRNLAATGQSLPGLVVDVDACPHLDKEFRNYRWQLNADGDPLKPERPVKAFDDALDALRYALYMTATRTRKKLLIA